MFKHFFFLFFFYHLLLSLGKVDWSPSEGSSIEENEPSPSVSVDGSEYENEDAVDSDDVGAVKMGDPVLSSPLNESLLLDGDDNMYTGISSETSSTVVFSREDNP